jgi:hypothetical protein
MTKVAMVKRAVAGGLVAGVAGALSACIAESPVVGSEVGGVDGRGTIALDGTVSSFIRTISFEAAGEDLCVPRELPMSEDGVIACNVFSARVPEAGPCSCGGAAATPELRREIIDTVAAFSLCGSNTGVDCEQICICESPRATGSSAEDCLNNPTTSASSTGWCLVDPERGLGAESLVDGCPPEFRRKIRILTPDPGATYVIACAGGLLREEDAPPGSRATGEPCLPRDERRSDFNGFGIQDVTLDLGTPECQTNLCLVNHFQGRASCPYGQPLFSDVEGTPQCLMPGDGSLVDVAVDPQLVERRAEDNAICSCRCAGPGPGPFCTCPEGMRCEPLIPRAGVPDEEAYAGSFCINAGTQYDPMHPPAADVCVLETMNCGEPHPY